MEKISNTEQLNTYFNIVNKLIDTYIKEHKVKPSELYKFLSKKSNLDKFIKQNEQLSNISNIKTVINNVITHRKNMELYQMPHYENFSYKDDFLIFPSNVDSLAYEKKLADEYKTSLGHITITDIEKRLFEVDDFGTKIEVVLLSPNDYNYARNTILEKTITDFKKRELRIDWVGDVNLEEAIILKLVDIIDDEKLKAIVEKKYDTDAINCIIACAITNSEKDFNTKNIGDYTCLVLTD